MEPNHKAAKQGDAKAQDSLGHIYYDGNGVVKDHEKAAEWFARAAEQGDAKAQDSLASMYLVSDTAADWFADVEQRVVKAQRKLVYLYYTAGGMAQSSEESAAEWYEKAAEQGDASAQNALATMYYIGKLLPQSFEKAKLWYERAVKQGNAKAQRGLAYLLFTVSILFPNMLKDEPWPVLDAPHTGGKTTGERCGAKFFEGSGAVRSSR